MDIQSTAAMFANLATVVGIPVALLVYVKERKRERQEREYGTYDALDEKYFEYLKLCLNNPELNLYYIPLELAPELSPEDKIRQYALFEILLSMMERAYLMYADQSTEVKRSQWEGWEAYIFDWLENPIFGELLKILGHQFDEGFSNHLRKLVSDNGTGK